MGQQKLSVSWQRQRLQRKSGLKHSEGARGLRRDSHQDRPSPARVLDVPTSNPVDAGRDAKAADRPMRLREARLRRCAAMKWGGAKVHEALRA